MKREEALSLLKELMVVCETLRYAPIVSLRMTEPNEQRWELLVKWVSIEEKGCFDETVRNKGLEVFESIDGYTVFRKPR
jgi:hypothetical protein